LRKAERKIPASLLKAICKREELAYQHEFQTSRIPSNVRKEIREKAIEAYLPQAPPSLTGIPVVIDPRSRTLYLGTVSTAQIDFFIEYFYKTTGLEPLPVNPESYLAKDFQVTPEELPNVIFSEQGDGEITTGRDFLTWLWYFSEACGGLATLDIGEFAVMIEGPLSFVFEGAGAHETVLRKGMPIVSAEAKTALTCGKKLKSAKVTFARGEDVWETFLDADEFVLRSTKLPKGENLDMASKFQDRVLALETLRQILVGFYQRFLDERLNPEEWQAVRSDIHKWVTGRKSKS
jgi:hypothetical protein